MGSRKTEEKKRKGGKGKGKRTLVIKGRAEEDSHFLIFFGFWERREKERKKGRGRRLEEDGYLLGILGFLTCPEHWLSTPPFSFSFDCLGR